jgi:Flp pilus assembly protein TadD
MRTAACRALLACIMAENVMKQPEIDTQIAEAWKAHYAGQNDVAIQRFQVLLQQTPNNVDANWGLGLAYRSMGDRENALEAFGKAQALIGEALEADPEDYERLFMLKRMVNQQIEQINDFLSQKP